ncbi:MAG TPA: hypothetical protein VJ716_06045 [Gaiellaceae bacterium]|nr:hypothetical protein [Gaiellaceae bacterium]
MSPAEARAQVARFERQWRAHLRARTDRRFPNPSRRWLTSQLRTAAGLCGCFTVLRVEVARVPRPAALVVVQGEDGRALLALSGRILDLIDHYPAAQGDENWAYEGFFLEAQDTARVPFFATALWPDSRTVGDQESGIWATPRLDRWISRNVHG